MLPADRPQLPQLSMENFFLHRRQVEVPAMFPVFHCGCATRRRASKSCGQSGGRSTWQRLVLRDADLPCSGCFCISASCSAMPYVYGRNRCMKKTLHIDPSLLLQAKSATGAKTDTEAVRLGLESLVRHAAYERLRTLRGSEPQAHDTRRRRERSATFKSSAA